MKNQEFCLRAAFNSDSPQTATVLVIVLKQFVAKQAIIARSECAQIGDALRNVSLAANCLSLSDLKGYLVKIQSGLESVVSSLRIVEVVENEDKFQERMSEFVKKGTQLTLFSHCFQTKVRESREEKYLSARFISFSIWVQK